MVCTEEIFIEYAETIDRLTKKSQKKVGKEIEPLLIENLEFIENTYSESYSRDSGDDKFINCARSGNVPYITGDKDLLVLKEIERIKIIGITEFLESTKE